MRNNVDVIALFVSVVSMMRSRETSKAMLDFEKIHAELSQRQIDEIDEGNMIKGKADIRISLNRSTRSGDKFIIENKGTGTAHEIVIELSQGCNFNPFIKNDYEGKVPYSLLNSGESFSLTAEIPVGISTRTFHFDVEWINSDDTTSKKKCVAS